MNRAALKKLLLPETILGVIFFFALYYLTVAVNFTTDRSDGIFHFLFAKSAPFHPELYLDLWAKPLFTLVASPFAQFGIQGMHFMNVLCALATAFICIRITRELNLKYTWLIFFLLIPMPVYFNQLCTAMTEPFFAMLLAIIVLLFVQKKFYASAILASVLPFARQEGYFLIPLMLMIFLLLKNWKAIPFLFSGILLFSVITQFATGDFFWFITGHPYTGAKDIYGSGTLFHFVENSEAMFGFLIQLLSAAGFIMISYLFIRKIKTATFSFQVNIPLVTEFLLIAGFAAGFFVAHSVMWWKGLFGSYGLERVMACIAPLIALMSLRAVNTIFSFTENKLKPYFQTILLLVISVLPLIILGSRSNFPPKENLSGGEETVAKAAEWLKAEKPFHSKIYFSHPYFILQLGLDPKGEKNSEELMYTNQGKEIPKNALVLWDSEYSKGQHHFPLQLLQQDSSYQLLKTVEGAEKTVVHIYRKN